MGPRLTTSHEATLERSGREGSRAEHPQEWPQESPVSWGYQGTWWCKFKGQSSGISSCKKGQRRFSVVSFEYRLCSASMINIKLCLKEKKKDKKILITKVAVDIPFPSQIIRYFSFLDFVDDYFIMVDFSLTIMISYVKMLILGSHRWICWQVNPDYQSTFLFENDFPALLQEGAPTPGTYGPGLSNFCQVHVRSN